MLGTKIRKQTMLFIGTARYSRSPRLKKSTGLLSFHIHPFDEGWLLGEIRGGRADVYDRHGRHQRSLNLGDASNDVQTTPDGKIWVSYFDALRSLAFVSPLAQVGVMFFVSFSARELASRYGASDSASFSRWHSPSFLPHCSTGSVQRIL